MEHFALICVFALLFAFALACHAVPSIVASRRERERLRSMKVD